MFTRPQFDDACKNFVEKYARLKDVDVHNKALLRWSWNEHSRWTGFGYLSRKTTMKFDMKQDVPYGDLDFSAGINEEDPQSTASAPSRTVEVAEYITYSPTYQVPAFYFSMHDMSGSPLALKDIIRTPLFRHQAFPDATRTDFALQAQHDPAPLLSQGEHPTLGTPCWYFHPCETPKALLELIKAEKDGSGTTPDPLRQLELWFLLISSVINDLV